MTTLHVTIVCEDCEADGPFSKEDVPTLKEIIRLWNGRPKMRPYKDMPPWLCSFCQHEDTGYETIIPIWEKCPRRYHRYKTNWTRFWVRRR